MGTIGESLGTRLHLPILLEIYHFRNPTSLKVTFAETSDLLGLGYVFDEQYFVADFAVEELVDCAAG